MNVVSIANMVNFIYFPLAHGFLVTFTKQLQLLLDNKSPTNECVRFAKFLRHFDLINKRYCSASSSSSSTPLWVEE